MKKTKWTFILLLSAVMILATMQSAQAMGKSALTIFGEIVVKEAPGTKYSGTITIYYVGLDKETLVPYYPDPSNGESMCWDTTLSENIFMDAPTQMLIFVMLKKGNNLFFFSWDRDVDKKLCFIRDENLQRKIVVEEFLPELIKSLYNVPVGGIPPPYDVKSVGDFTDAYTIIDNKVIGLDQNTHETDLGFMMINLVIAVQE